MNRDSCPLFQSTNKKFRVPLFLILWDIQIKETAARRTVEGFYQGGFLHLAHQQLDVYAGVDDDYCNFDDDFVDGFLEEMEFGLQRKLSPYERENTTTWGQQIQAKNQPFQMGKLQLRFILILGGF